MAASTDKTYTCPVERQMMFKMENTRICRICAAGSNRQEVFTNLSLDLIPGCETVDELLMSYLKETNLEYRCECGSTLSGQRSSFATLPRVLVLHLKRFRYTSFYTLKKDRQPIHLNKDLVVSTKQDACVYSLVSIINHIGKNAGGGHYTSDGVDPDVEVEDPDCWFTYDDARVTKTSGAYVCKKRKQSAYILFYKRHD
ncbi:ubiquitin carboxyl-terminal hydrolase 37-like [Labrus mixtus]|uniref:ubiquitin carboxyl-terminal hydrolase 37-like n=1 Tax=Labrus mixtus TaxID=508554 RepID=UPI0029BFB437|nr:ubiquitin carboxyl-terminal hydrolase 37-like [Labrus mixtus]